VIGACAEHGISECHACRLVKQPRGTQRYRPTQREDEDALTQAIVALASQYGRVSPCRRSAAARLYLRGKAQDCGSINTADINRMNKAQTARSCRLPTGRRRSHSRGSLRIVSGLAENTNSIFCDGPSEPETANGCLVLPSAGTDAERPYVRAVHPELADLRALPSAPGTP
jgi:hypothetical protein